MVVVQRLTKGVEGQKGERNKTIILWAGGPYAFVGEPPPVIFFASHERNKIKILLRSKHIYAIIEPYKANGYRRSIYEALF